MLGERIPYHLIDYQVTLSLEGLPLQLASALSRDKESTFWNALTYWKTWES